MKFYEVTSNFYDCGRVTVAITNVIEANTKPDDIVKYLKKCDVYIDYFNSRKEAEEFMKGTNK